VVTITTPACPFGRAGVLASVSMAVAVSGATSGCDRPPQRETLALDSLTLEIEGSIHDVRLAGAGATDSIVPVVVEAEPGDAVRFIAADRRPHAPAFVADSLSAPVGAFLEETGQLRGPPLVNQGASWVILLQGAPPGRYPFHCRAHDAFGVLIVRPGDRS
jgi:plastocyanin